MQKIFSLKNHERFKFKYTSVLQSIFQVDYHTSQLREKTDISNILFLMCREALANNFYTKNKALIRNLSLQIVLKEALLINKLDLIDL